jgi:polysaccharide export outer membrane protein
MLLSKQAALAVAVAFGACFAAVSPTAAQSAPAAQPRQLTPPYRINPGDELEIYVWG